MCISPRPLNPDVFGLSNTSTYIGMQRWCDDDVVDLPPHILMRIWFNTSDLTQRSGLVTRIASDLGWVHQKNGCTVRSIIGLRQLWVRTADDGNSKWATVCVVDGGGGVNIIDTIFLLARQSHHAPRIVTVPVLLLVGIVRVHYLYLSPQICKYQIFSADIL
jgi:hypothetical protein